MTTAHIFNRTTLERNLNLTQPRQKENINSNLVSIIIPIFNREHLISQTLDSVMDQTYENWECVVVDDGSTDKTVEIVAAYAVKNNRIRYYKRPKSLIKGASTCRNIGFKKSKGALIKFLDSDDILFEQAIEHQTNAFNTKTDVVVSPITFFNFEKNESIKNNTIHKHPLLEKYFIGEIAFYVSGPLWTRNFLNESTFLFDEKISNLDDWDFNLRMIYRSPNILYDNKPILYYRIHSNSLTSEIKKLNIDEIKSEIRARENHLKILKNNSEIDYKTLVVYVKNRYKYFMRASLVLKTRHSFYFLAQLVKYQFKLGKFPEMSKSVFGFFFFYMFKKGYRLL